MKNILLVICLITPLIVFGQGVRNQNESRIAQLVESYDFSTTNSFELFETGSRFDDITGSLKHFETLILNQELLDSILSAKPEHLKLSVKYNEEVIDLLLVKNEIIGTSYVLKNERNVELQSNTNGVFYKGMVKGDNFSIASVSLFENEIRICFSDEITNYRVSKNRDYGYIIYRDHDLDHVSEFECQEVTTGVQINEQEENQYSYLLNTSSPCQYVEIFFECDYEFYQDEGSSIVNVEQQILANFNEVQIIYFNESIPIVISEILVWTSPDPYLIFDDTHNILNEFKSLRGDDFDGKLAHFISTRDIGGGRGFIFGLLSDDEHYAVSGNINSWSNSSFPDYSWNVEIIAHELGHNFGSVHTHNCGWGNGQIDDCGNIYAISNEIDDDEDDEIDEIDEAEGESCFDPSNPLIPNNGGTIMSYCHLNNTGINFSNGFGELPGDQIRNIYTLSYADCHSWVDYDDTNVFENGTFHDPWDTLLEAVDHVPDGGIIFIKSSIGNEILEINTDKNFFIRSWEGVAIIGQ